MANEWIVPGDVGFDYAAAGELADALRSSARVVAYQAGERARMGAQAKEVWRGVYGGHFDQRLASCVGDGQRLAKRLRAVANRLDQAATDARAEQRRREPAR
ncbi:MAG: hypothetical protein ACRD0K_19235 [Egibacteraceae bacterium]